MHKHNCPLYMCTKDKQDTYIMGWMRSPHTSHCWRVEVHYHFVHERVAKKLLDIKLISTHDHVVDGFTKPLSIMLLEQLKHILNMSTLWLRGSVWNVPHICKPPDDVNKSFPSCNQSSKLAWQRSEIDWHS